MTKQGLGVLKANGLQPAGPWVVDLGRSSEITYLFRYSNLAERERLIARFAETAEARTFDAKVGELVEEVTRRLLIPTPFSLKPSAPEKEPKPAISAVLPHRQQIAPGIHAAGFADRFRSANCGWVALAGETLLIDLPRGLPITDFLTLVAATTGKPARRVALTNFQDGDTAIIQTLIEAGVTRVLTSPATRSPVAHSLGFLDPANLHALANRTPIGDAAVPSTSYRSIRLRLRLVRPSRFQARHCSLPAR